MHGWADAAACALRLVWFLSVVQVNGGSQSFNAVNGLRILGRWMRMVTIPNQSSVPKVVLTLLACCSCSNFAWLTACSFLGRALQTNSVTCLAGLDGV